MNIIQSQMIPIRRSHVDTDLIIPAEFLKSVSRNGFGMHLFAGLREADANFSLNLERYQGATIMVSGMNFGCGSSREHAAWALGEWGIRVIIAPSFADIFRQNALNNRILPVVLHEHVIEKIFDEETQQYPYIIQVDLPNQTLKLPSGDIYDFSIDPYKKECLQYGIDDFDYLLAKRPQINVYDKKNQAIRFFNTYAVKEIINEVSP